MKDLKKQLEIIAERASEYLRNWGIDGYPISVSVAERGEIRRFWGKESWMQPTYVFLCDGVEIGAYSDKAKAIKVTVAPTILGRLRSTHCKCLSPKLTLPFSVDFLLALKAFRHYLVKHYPTVYHTNLFVDLDGRLSLATWKPKLRIDFYPDRAVLLDGSGKTILEGTPKEILLAVRKFYAFSCL